MRLRFQRTTPADRRLPPTTRWADRFLFVTAILSNAWVRDQNYSPGNPLEFLLSDFGLSLWPDMTVHSLEISMMESTLRARKTILESRHQSSLPFQTWSRIFISLPSQRFLPCTKRGRSVADDRRQRWQRAALRKTSPAFLLRVCHGAAGFWLRAERHPRTARKEPSRSRTWKTCECKIPPSATARALAGCSGGENKIKTSI